MPHVNDQSRDLWLFLLQDGGAWTAADLVQEFGDRFAKASELLRDMAEDKRVQRLPRIPGNRRSRYVVTGTCRVPLGLCVAEVQAD